MKKILLSLILFLSFSMQSANPSGMRSYIQNAPKITKHNQLKSVVNYLTRRYRNDEDKALSILTWIVMNIDYDEYYYQKSVDDNKSRRDLSRHIPEQGDIIETRLGVCKDIAALYSEMLKMADIDSQVISGCVAPKNDRKTCQENPHAWNVVWLNRQWELVDPTYAMGNASKMGNITSKGRYDRAVKKRMRSTSDTYKPRSNRSVDTTWFMTDPKIMGKDHHPNDKKWYLTKNKDKRNKD